MEHKNFPVFLLIKAFALLGFVSSPALDFQNHVYPIFEANCIDCHGPDKDKSGLRLDQRAQMLVGGDTGLPTIVPGDWESSYLMEVVTHLDEEMAMPPKGDKLTEKEIETLEQWVNAGAQWPGQMDAVLEVGTDHWSFQEVERPEVPADFPAKNPIDSFIDAKLAAAGLSRSEKADAKSLARRATITLTGLPPTPEEITAFEAAYEADPDKAYTALVDRLFASPHFGERWAQHWLDVIRWAETNGSEANLYRKNAWIYRDYVIRAFNEDLPYDQFITEQLAGDQLGVGEATGFLVAGPHVPAATVGREPSAIRQARADRMDEVMQTIGASMLGVTVSCARCHNHKFDPVSIQDYYALTAVFQGVEFGGRYPEFSDDHPRKQRARELYQEIGKERKILREGAGQWEENWGGFAELLFPPTKTTTLRIEFDRPSIFIDEFQVFSDTSNNQNLALASKGTKLKEDPDFADKGSPVTRANDGKFGTMVWKSKAPKDSKEKPWVEITFPEEKEVSRFRYSSNREYFFETDYLDKKMGYNFPGVRILAKQGDGSWLEVGKTKAAKQKIAKRDDLKKASEKLHSLLETLREDGPQHSFVGQFSDPEPTRVLHRGSPENPRDVVVPAGFTILEGDLGLTNETPEEERRLEFAKWLTEPNHPLTARVQVNRIWHHIFGSGIVPTASDFGKAGAPPTHPLLLDWLAAEFVEPTQTKAAPWSMKAMIRLILLSETFRQSSLPDEKSLAVDGSTNLLWRFPPRRVEAEVIRDGILQASGKLDNSIGGRSFRIHNVKKTYAQWEVVNNHGPETWRRMIYQERMRRVDDQIFTAFDFPDCGQVRAKRPVSTTPLQALNLMNSNFAVEQAGFIAERAAAESKSPEEALTRAFELILTRTPTEDEKEAALPIASKNGLHIVCRTLINSNEFAFLP